MPLVFAIVPRWRRSVFVVAYALSNAILASRTPIDVDDGAWPRRKRPAGTV
jgi:hypothetical protein